MLPCTSSRAHLPGLWATPKQIPDASAEHNHRQPASSSSGSAALMVPKWVQLTLTLPDSLVMPGENLRPGTYCVDPPRRPQLLVVVAPHWFKRSAPALCHKGSELKQVPLLPCCFGARRCRRDAPQAAHRAQANATSCVWRGVRPQPTKHCVMQNSQLSCNRQNLPAGRCHRRGSSYTLVLHNYVFWQFHVNSVHKSAIKGCINLSCCLVRLCAGSICGQTSCAGSRHAKVGVPLTHALTGVQTNPVQHSAFT